MKVNVIQMIGFPGSGKTWVMKQLINKLDQHTTGKFGMFLYHFGLLNKKPVLIVGKYDGSTFEGSDKLSMALMRDLRPFLEFLQSSKKPEYLVVEGDRFMNSTFINETRAYSKIVRILDSGEKGRKMRGSNQSERQLKTMATRVSKVVADVNVTDSTAALKWIRNQIK